MSKIFIVIFFSIFLVACVSSFDADNFHHHFGFGQHVLVNDSIVKSNSN